MANFILICLTVALSLADLHAQEGRLDVHPFAPADHDLGHHGGEDARPHHHHDTRLRRLHPTLRIDAMTIDTDRITSHRFWRDAPMLCDALVRDEILPVEDDRLLGTGILTSIRAGLGRSAARRRALRLLEALFRNQPTSLNLVWTPVKVILEDEQTNVFLLAHTGRVVWFNGFEHFDEPGTTVWSAGYLSDGGWLWSDLNRVEHIRDATMGSHHFLKGVLKPGRLADAETILRAT